MHVWVCGKLWRDSGGNVTICIFQVKWDGWLQLILQWPLAKERSPAESSSRTLEQMRAIQSGCLCMCMWCFKYSLFMDLRGPLSLYRRRLYADKSEWNTTGPFNICSRLCLIMQLRTPCLCIFTVIITIYRTHRPLRFYLSTFKARKWCFVEAEANKLSTFKDTKGREGISPGRHIYMQIYYMRKLKLTLF